MNTDQKQIHGRHDDLTEGIIGVFFDVYNELGYGFLESVYREAMRIALSEAGYYVRVEIPVEVTFRGSVVGVFRADLLVNDAVLIELKTCDSLIREHESQTLHYLRATKIEVALLMNFGATPKFKRFVMNNEMKKPSNATTRSVASVQIGARPLAGAEVII